ncbi:MAG: helix-turn-helix domain-containing protein [Clostridiales bacterium]|nr:helix-turn-helix domain-containing protein [Clostridiales bacterium]
MRNSIIKPEQGKRLKSCLTRKNKTQKWLSEATYISQQTISKIINGESRLTNENALLFSRALNVRLDYLLLEDDYMTDVDRFKAIAQSRNEKDIACYALIDALGYKIIDMKMNPDGSKSSMHKPLKQVRINKDDTDEQILEKVHDAPFVRYYIIENPEGKRTQVDMEDMLKIQMAIKDYAVFQLEQPFQFLKKIDKWAKKPSISK